MKALGEFGIKLNWKFDFLDPGTTVNSLPNTFFVDVGNQLTHGIIDTHQRTNFRSSAHALSHHPDLLLNHLLKGLNEAYARGEKGNIEVLQQTGIEFTFITHKSPDWDSIATFYLSDHLLRHGKLPEPPHLNWLIDATNQIDQGTVRMKGKFSRPFMIYYQISSDGWGADAWRDHILLGKRLVEEVLELGRNQSYKDNPFIKEDDALGETLPNFNEHLKELSNDWQLYQEDCNKSHAFPVELPLKEGGDACYYHKVKALCFEDEPKCKLHKYWARDKGEYKLLLIPRKNNSEKINQWIISVDPNDKYDLRRLGYKLEQKETQKRGDDHKRSGAPRWDDEGYSDNNNPWYDGRDHDYTIVDSPRGGTFLEDVQEIKEVLDNRFHGITIPENKADCLTFFFYFELPDHFDLEELTGSKGFNHHAKPFKSFDRAFKFIQDIELYEKQDGAFQDGNEFFVRAIWVSECTQHGVLKLSTKNFHDLISGHTSQSVNILEDLGGVLDQIEQLAEGLAANIIQEHGFPCQIWGMRSFRFMELGMPDLKFQDAEKVLRVLNDILRDKITMDKIDQLMNQGGVEFIKSSHALCILSDDSDEEGKLSNDRHLLLFYALFLKSGYRHFSERMSKAAENLGAVGMKPLGKIQEDYSIFLGKYEFAGREVNTDDGLQAFFIDVLSEVGFKGQKDETRHEMRTAYDLAASRNRESLENENRNLQGFVVGVGILALGDFIYQWSTAEKSFHLHGLFVLAFLLVIAVLFFKSITKRWPWAD